MEPSFMALLKTVSILKRDECICQAIIRHHDFPSKTKIFETKSDVVK